MTNRQRTARGRIAVVLALAGWTPWTSPSADVEAGNRALAAGQYDAALAAYARAAQAGQVDPAGLAYDRGTALLRKAETVADPTEKQALIARGLDDLRLAARSADPQVRGDAHYNRGNSLMAQEKWADAAAAYRQALHENPNLDDARVNLELALKHRIRQEQQQQGSQPGQQGQQGQGQGQQGQGQPGQQPGQPGQGPSGQQGPAPGQRPQDAQGGSAQSGAQGSTNGSDAGGSGDAQGSNLSGSNGAGDTTGSNANPAGSGDANQTADQPGGAGHRGHARGTHGASPKTPSDRKLDDLEDFSRHMQKDGAKRHAIGHTADPTHDW